MSGNLGSIRHKGIDSFSAPRRPPTFKPLIDKRRDRTFRRLDGEPVAEAGRSAISSGSLMMGGFRLRGPLRGRVGGAGAGGGVTLGVGASFSGGRTGGPASSCKSRELGRLGKSSSVLNSGLGVLQELALSCGVPARRG